MPLCLLASVSVPGTVSPSLVLCVSNPGALCLCPWHSPGLRASLIHPGFSLSANPALLLHKAPHIHSVSRFHPRPDFCRLVVRESL